MAGVTLADGDRFGADDGHGGIEDGSALGDPELHPSLVGFTVAVELPLDEFVVVVHRHVVAGVCTALLLCFVYHFPVLGVATGSGSLECDTLNAISLGNCQMTLVVISG